MGDPKIAVGLQIGAQPSLGTVRAFALFARLARLDSVMAGPPPELEEAIAAVPPRLVEEGPLMWGTPEQLASQLREFGEVGLRHVVLAPVSGLFPNRAAIYGIRATRKIARLMACELSPRVLEEIGGRLFARGCNDLRRYL